MKRLKFPQQSTFAAVILGIASCSAPAEPSGSMPGANPICTPPSSPVKIPAGIYTIGSTGTYQEEGPKKQVEIAAFWIEPTEVTVARFREFVSTTGYVTTAERAVDEETISGFELSEEEKKRFLSPGGAVFSPQHRSTPSDFDWWHYVPGANWKTPEGPNGDSASSTHPVTQVSYEDAVAFAAWAGGRLPTEVQWEIAATARNRQSNSRREPPKNANTWQGIFPVQNSEEDGFVGIAPVGCFEPNSFGLYDMIGNVWEWTSNAYTPRRDIETDPRVELSATHRTLKGGSFLCSENYCLRYRPAARQAQESGLGTNHIGFRVAYDTRPY